MHEQEQTIRKSEEALRGKTDEFNKILADKEKSYASKLEEA